MGKDSEYSEKKPIFALIIQILYEFRCYYEAFRIILYAACVINVISTEAVFPFYW